MGKYVGIVAALALIAYFGFAHGVVNALFGPEPDLYLEHPLPYTFTAQDCLPSGRQCSEVRYYVPRGK